MKSLKKKKRLKPMYKSLIILVVIVAIGAVVFFVSRKNNQKTVAVSPTSSNSSTASTTGGVSTLPYHAPVINPTSNVPGGTTPAKSSVSLAAPSGEFVNNHGASTDPAVTANSNEVSTCTTTPGATCQIEFTNGSTTKKLATQITSTGSSKDAAPGQTSWSWTPSGVGLSPGQWKIMAIASLNGSTKSTQDLRELTISQ
jgi:cytoskeletal protein RodZ